jgi:hypothetical protein
MSVPPQPYIDLQLCSIVPSGTDLKPNQTFYWYNPTNSNCSVTITGVWCTAPNPSPNPVTSGNYSSSTVASNCPAGDYGWTGSPCCPAAMPVHVSAG